MITNYNENDFYITDRDIEVAQQLAIWHYSNENTVTGNTTFGNLLGNSELTEIYQTVYQMREKQI